VPAVKNAGEKRRGFKVHGGARKLPRRRYVKKRSGAREPKETEVETEEKS
jgi:hypothetical protein